LGEWRILNPHCPSQMTGPRFGLANLAKGDYIYMVYTMYTSGIYRKYRFQMKKQSEASRVLVLNTI
jgi:hypothetical protein